MKIIDGWKQHVKGLKIETYAIYLASKDPRVPWHAKALIIFVLAHTLSPIDLIPDFIPVLGYLDDLIITPLGIAFALKLIPKDVLAGCREEAQKKIDQGTSISWVAAALVISIWLVILAIIVTISIRIIRTIWLD